MEIPEHFHLIVDISATRRFVLGNSELLHLNINKYVVDLAMHVSNY